MEDFSKWILSFRQYMQKGILSEKAFEIVSKGSNKEDLSSTIKSVVNINDSLVAQQSPLFKLINTDCITLFEKNFNEVTFKELKKQLELWKSSQSLLIDWSHFINYKKQCLCTVAAPFIHSIDNDEILGKDLVYAFYGNYTDSLLRTVFKEKKILNEFRKENQDNNINKFREFDKKIISLNRQRIINAAYCHKPDIFTGATRGSEAYILLKEFTKKRKHLPIRELMTLSGGLIQKIKPCFMMSPLSIAQYLDPRKTKFDVIIFDEASQVRPEDAIGALMRGSQVIVMGDSRQLPPTNFFDHITEALDPDIDDEAVHNDVESILNVCKRCFPQKLLRNS